MNSKIVKNLYEIADEVLDAELDYNVRDSLYHKIKDRKFFPILRIYVGKDGDIHVVGFRKLPRWRDKVAESPGNILDCVVPVSFTLERVIGLMKGPFYWNISVDKFVTVEKKKLSNGVVIE